MECSRSKELLSDYIDMPGQKHFLKNILWPVRAVEKTSPH